MWDVFAAIAAAEALLPGEPALDDEEDPRWQAIIEVSEFVHTHPRPVWEFILRWSSRADDDLQAALATCLLEHLLECHFAIYFPLVERRAALSHEFAQVFCLCDKLGEAEEPANAVRFDNLVKQVRRR